MNDKKNKWNWRKALDIFTRHGTWPNRGGRIDPRHSPKLKPHIRLSKSTKVDLKRSGGSSEDAEVTGVAAQNLLARQTVAAVARPIAGHLVVAGRTRRDAKGRRAGPVARSARCSPSPKPNDHVLSPSSKNQIRKPSVRACTL